MLMTMLVMAFAVSGGLYLGTIVFSAYKLAEVGRAEEFLEKLEGLLLA